MLEHFNKWPNSEARGWQRANDKRFRWSSQDQSANDKRFRPSHPEGAPREGAEPVEGQNVAEMHKKKSSL